MRLVFALVALFVGSYASADVSLNCDLNGQPLYSSRTGLTAENYVINDAFTYDSFSAANAEYRFEVAIRKMENSFWVNGEVINMDKLDGRNPTPGLGVELTVSYELPGETFRGLVIHMINNAGDEVACRANAR
jgi:hypothetical protein